MGNRKVIWLRKTQKFVEEYLEWYEENMGRHLAERFFNALTINARRIAINPEMGKMEPVFVRSGFYVRSILIDKHFRMYYRYNQSQVVIITVWDMSGVIRH